MEKRQEQLITRIDEILTKFPAVKKTWCSSMGDSWFKDTVAYEALITECYQLLAHIHSSGGHPDIQRTIHAINDASLRSLEQVEGILVGTRSNIEAGLLEKLTSRIMIDLKSDFLETAQQLLDDGDKDPAAVLACVVLEDSLKRLAKNHGVENLDSKEMSVVANGLLGKKIIEKTTNQSIQGFKSLRNAALHAQWNEVSAETVTMLLTFLPVFLEKHGL